MTLAVPLSPGAVALAKETLATKSKSFALASHLLPAARRDEMAVLYAWCRHVDDAIDLAPRAERPAALARLRGELDEVYGGAPESPILAAFADLVRARRIPRAYPEELLAGMEMDVLRARYVTLADLELYCFRVAGVVGLMACHVLGVSEPGALRNAAHLGIAMQLTNVCRDVEEDLADGRVYLPSEMLGTSLERPPAEGSPTRAAVQRTVATLLALAERYYRSADRGLPALGLRPALGIRVARQVYAAIGAILRRRAFDPFRGRAFVPLLHKLALVLLAVVLTLAELPARLLRRRAIVTPDRVLGFPHDVLPV
ncbi:MAG: phytoene/squalene synthase family protein [Myxococcales bacterium]|nr:phytoene/squalene synthase family protein [Myxococcales bacterium]